MFTPSGVASVDPAGVVVPMLPPQVCNNAETASDVEDVDTDLCVQGPLFSSAEAAQGWLADHPGGRVFSITQAWDLRFLRDWRDRMSALLNLGS